VTGESAREPTLAEVQEEFPAWECTRGVNDLCYATHTATGTQVRGEDPLDLRDMIRGAEARLSWDQAEDPGPPGPGPAGDPGGRG
jgi:hypothetical protein